MSMGAVEPGLSMQCVSHMTIHIANSSLLLSTSYGEPCNRLGSEIDGIRLRCGCFWCSLTRNHKPPLTHNTNKLRLGMNKLGSGTHRVKTIVCGDEWTMSPVRPKWCSANGAVWPQCSVIISMIHTRVVGNSYQATKQPEQTVTDWTLINSTGSSRLGPASQSIGPGQLVGRAHARTIGPTSMESYKLSQGCRPTYRKTI